MLLLDRQGAKADVFTAHRDAGRSRGRSRAGTLRADRRPSCPTRAPIAGSASSSTTRPKAEALEPYFDRLALIVIAFPSGTDGRGFSLARQLRRRGFTGILRASGPLFSDQFPQALACGFHEVEIPDANAARQPVEQWLAAANRISLAYQRNHARDGKHFRPAPRRAERRGRRQCLRFQASSADQLNEAFADADLPERLRLIRRAVKGRIVFTTSLGVEDQALTHAIRSEGLDFEIVTLDTGRLFPETYDLWARTEEKYGFRLKAFFPRADAVEALVTDQGVNGFYYGLDMRKACCGVRKVEPLARALEGASIWIAGLRADQSAHRSGARFVEFDAARGLIKASPLLDFSREDVVAYCVKNDVPINVLHERGFVSIGCAPVHPRAEARRARTRGTLVVGRRSEEGMRPACRRRRRIAQRQGNGGIMIQLTHLQKLEAESIHIFREVAAECENPVFLYSIGKDSAVLLHLAMKAFYPSKPPFQFLHVDTTWKFREMIAFRDQRDAGTRPRPDRAHQPGRRRRRRQPVRFRLARCIPT